MKAFFHKPNCFTQHELEDLTRLINHITSRGGGLVGTSPYEKTEPRVGKPSEFVRELSGHWGASACNASTPELGGGSSRVSGHT